MKHGSYWLISALLLSAAQARATTIAAFTFDQLCEKAEAVYRVRCVGSRSTWDDVRCLITTTTTLRVLDAVKGGEQEIFLRLPGGTVNDTTLTIPDFPVFRGNDEMVIFLTGRDDAGYPWPVGMGQGIYPVVRDAAGLAKVAVRPGLNPSPLSKPAAGRPDPETLPLNDFIDLVRARIRTPSGAESR